MMVKLTIWLWSAHQLQVVSKYPCRCQFSLSDCVGVGVKSKLQRQEKGGYRRLGS